MAKSVFKIYPRKPYFRVFALKGSRRAFAEYRSQIRTPRTFWRRLAPGAVRNGALVDLLI